MNEPHHPTAFERERQQQIQAGRTIGQHNENTHRPISTRPGYQGKRPMENRGKPVGRPGPKGHDAIIKDLTQRQARVMVYTREDMQGAATHEGVITGSDRYTISLKLAYPDRREDGFTVETLVIYKHAMQGFSELKQAA